MCTIKKCLVGAIFISIALPQLSSAFEKVVVNEAINSICYNVYGDTVPCLFRAENNKAGSDEAPLYRDNGNNTVTDLRNGWVWQKVGDTSVNTHSASSEYCGTLEVGTLKDWRMPSEAELKTIADYGRSQNIINPVFSCEEGNYWTATLHKSAADKYQTVGFFIADGNAYPGNATHFVRCVHRDK